MPSERTQVIRMSDQKALVIWRFVQIYISIGKREREKPPFLQGVIMRFVDVIPHYIG